MTDPTRHRTPLARPVAGFFLSLLWLALGCAAGSSEGWFGGEREELPLIEILDFDGNSRLSRSEIARASLRLPGLDRNGDGHVDAWEFTGGLAQPTEVRRQPLFRQLDQDRDGILSRLEMTEASERIATLDLNGDGRISRREAFGS